MQHGPAGAGAGNVALQASREKKRWAAGENKTKRARLSGKRLPIFQIVFSILFSKLNQIQIEFQMYFSLK